MFRAVLNECHFVRYVLTLCLNLLLDQRSDFRAGFIQDEFSYPMEREKSRAFQENSFQTIYDTSDCLIWGLDVEKWVSKVDGFDGLYECTCLPGCTCFHRLPVLAIARTKLGAEMKT